MTLGNAGRAAGRPHYLRLAGMAGPQVTLTIGAPIPLRAYPDPQALAEAARGAVLGLRREKSE